jgi:hypothetical protein
MKTEPLPGSKAAKLEGPRDRSEAQPGFAVDQKPWTLPYWAIVSNELDEKLALSKAEFRVFCHYLRRCGRDNTPCYAGVKSISRLTRTHPVYVRFIRAQLAHRGLLIITQRPGRTPHVSIADKNSWLARNEGKPQPAAPMEEDVHEAKEKVLLYRFWSLCPGAPRLPFGAWIKRDPALFQRVLDSLADDIARAEDPRRAAEKGTPIKDKAAYVKYYWSLWGGGK